MIVQTGKFVTFSINLSAFLINLLEKLQVYRVFQKFPGNFQASVEQECGFVLSLLSSFGMSEGEKSARKMLEEMGFDGAAARQALIESGGDLMKALELLALSSTDKDANAALEVARQVEIQERAAEEKLSEETIRKLQKMEEIGAEKKEKVAVGKGSLVRAQSEDSRELEKMEKNLAGKGMDAETRSLLLIEHMQMLEEKKEKEKAEKETRSLLLIAELQMLEEKKEKDQAEREARDLGMALQLEEQNEMERKSLAVAREMEDKQMVSVLSSLRGGGGANVFIADS